MDRIRQIIKTINRLYSRNIIVGYARPGERCWDGARGKATSALAAILRPQTDHAAPSAAAANRSLSAAAAAATAATDVQDHSDRPTGCTTEVREISRTKPSRGSVSFFTRILAYLSSESKTTYRSRTTVYSHVYFLRHASTAMIIVDTRKTSIRNEAGFPDHRNTDNSP